MKFKADWRLDRCRKVHPILGGSPRGANWGYFLIRKLQIISSGTPDRGNPGEGWEHVSVSCTDRCPTWDEMQEVKNLFWASNETVIQFHPRADQYVNRHPHCLHLWKPIGVEITLPPTELIG